MRLNGDHQPDPHRPAFEPPPSPDNSYSTPCQDPPYTTVCNSEHQEPLSNLGTGETSHPPQDKPDAV